MEKIIDGVRLAYDDAGRGGDAVVLVHGFLLDRTIWDAQFAALARRGRVVRLDLRGSGESDCDSGPALMETLAGDVYGLLDALGIERAIVAGHSLGGYVALAFFRMYAERVRGLALSATRIGADSPERRAERDALGVALAAHGIEPAVAAALAPGTFAPDIDARARSIARRASPAGAAATLVGMRERVGSEDLLEDIAVPVALIGGERDPSLADYELERTARAIAGAAVVRITGAGRLPMLEAPDPTTRALDDLIARCDQPLSRSA